MFENLARLLTIRFTYSSFASFIVHSFLLDFACHAQRTWSVSCVACRCLIIECCFTHTYTHTDKQVYTIIRFVACAIDCLLFLLQCVCCWPNSLLHVGNDSGVDDGDDYVGVGWFWRWKHLANGRAYKLQQSVGSRLRVGVAVAVAHLTCYQCCIAYKLACMRASRAHLRLCLSVCECL